MKNKQSHSSSTVDWSELETGPLGKEKGNPKEFSYFIFNFPFLKRMDPGGGWQPPKFFIFQGDHGRWTPLARPWESPGEERQEDPTSDILPCSFLTISSETWASKNRIRRVEFCVAPNPKLCFSRGYPILIKELKHGQGLVSSTIKTKIIHGGLSVKK